MTNVEAIYRRYGLQVLRRCQRILRNDAEAEDVVHEVFMRVMEAAEARGADKGLPAAPEEAMAVLYRASTNLCLNRLRDRGRRERENWQSAARDAWTGLSARGAETQVIERALLLSLARDVPEELLALGVYYWVDGMNQSEIAQVAGLARGTVNRKLGELAALLKARADEVLS